MAASDNHQASGQLNGARPCLTGPALMERVEEEIARAQRHGLALSCLLVGVRDAAATRRVHGEELLERALAYLGLALRREFRRFDRVGRLSGYEHLVVLPGADGARGEMIARRVLARVQAIKLESQGRRGPLAMAVAVATWREGLTADELVAQARAAAGGRTSGQQSAGPYGQQSTGPSEQQSARPYGDQSKGHTPTLPVGPLGFF
jgi:GGDEF domain-containing protein